MEVILFSIQFKKEINWRGDKFLLHIVDTAGEDEFSIFQNHVGIDGYVLVYNIVNKKSFDTIRVLNEKILNESANENVPRVIVGNKIDLDGQRKITREQGEKMAKELGCCGFVETSGAYLKVDGISVKAKDWLLDPTDIKIVATNTATAATGAASPGRSRRASRSRGPTARPRRSGSGRSGAGRTRPATAVGGASS